MSQPTTLSSDNAQLLKNLSQYPLNLDDINKIVSKNDLYILLNQFPNVFALIGSVGGSSIIFNASSTQKLVSWGPSTSVGVNATRRIFVTISSPGDDAGTYRGGWSYVFYINKQSGGSVSVPTNMMSITMENGIGNSSVPMTALPNFKLNTYSDGHIEFGFSYASVSGTTNRSSYSLYLDTQTAWDGTIFPVINAIADTPLTSSPSTSLSLATTDGTNWYSWATTSTASGGTTHGYV